MRSIRRLLRTSGKLAISTPNPQTTANYGSNPYHLPGDDCRRVYGAVAAFLKHIVMLGQWVRPGILIGEQ